MSRKRGRVTRINDFGLCIVISDETRFGFTLDKLSGYFGQPLRDIGLVEGAEVSFESDELGRIRSAQLDHAPAAAS